MLLLAVQCLLWVIQVAMSDVCTAINLRHAAGATGAAGNSICSFIRCLIAQQLLAGMQVAAHSPATISALLILFVGITIILLPACEPAAPWVCTGPLLPQVHTQGLGNVAQKAAHSASPHKWVLAQGITPPMSGRSALSRAASVVTLQCCLHALTYAPSHDSSTGTNCHCTSLPAACKDTG